MLFRNSSTCLTALAAALFIASPALADCQDDIAALEGQVTAGETGDAPDESGIPATKHQSEVLEGEQETMESSGTADGTTAPSTEHQEKTLETMEHSPDVAELLQQARDHAEAGDEEACNQKVEEARSLLAD